MSELAIFKDGQLPSRAIVNSLIEKAETYERLQQLDKFVDAAKALVDDPIKKADLAEWKERIRFKIADMKTEAQGNGKFAIGRPENDSGGNHLSLRSLGLTGRKLNEVNRAGNVPIAEREQHIQIIRDKVINPIKKEAEAFLKEVDRVKEENEKLFKNRATFVINRINDALARDDPSKVLPELMKLSSADLEVNDLKLVHDIIEACLQLSTRATTWHRKLSEKFNAKSN